MYQFDYIVGNIIEVSAFGDVLSDKFVGVFDDVLLSESIRIGKEDGYAFESLGLVSMASELKAFVSGDGVDILRDPKIVQLLCWTRSVQIHLGEKYIFQIESAQRANKQIKSLLHLAAVSVAKHMKSKE